MIDLPLQQEVALTGSVNQRGEVQAIGGVNEKIEGFFDICKLRGLTGQQKVIIPASNQNNLMLSNEVTQAVKNKLFAIHVVSSVDEALALLAGKKPGTENAHGHFPESSINGRVVERLKKYSTLVQQLQTSRL